MAQDTRVVVYGVNSVINAQAEKQELGYDAVHPENILSLKNKFTPTTNISATIAVDFENNGKEIVNVKTEYTDAQTVGTLALNTSIYEENSDTQQVIRKDTPAIKVCFLPPTERIDLTDDVLVQTEQQTVKNAVFDVFGDINVNYNFIHKVKDPVLGKDAANKDYIDKRVPVIPTVLDIDYAPYYGWHNSIGGFIMIKDYTLISNDIIQTVFVRKLQTVTTDTIPYKICRIEKANKQVTFLDNSFNNLPTFGGQTKPYALCPLPSLNSIGCIVIADGKVWLGRKQNSVSTTEQTIWTEITVLFNNANFLNNVVFCNDVRYAEGTIHFLFSAEKVNNEYDEQYYVTLQETDLVAFLEQQTTIQANITAITRQNYGILKINKERVLFTSLYKTTNLNEDIYYDLSGDSEYDRSFLTLDDYYSPNVIADNLNYDIPKCIFTYYNLSDNNMKGSDGDSQIVPNNSDGHAPYITYLPEYIRGANDAVVYPVINKWLMVKTVRSSETFVSREHKDDTTNFNSVATYLLRLDNPLMCVKVQEEILQSNPLKVFNSYMDKDVYICDCGDQTQASGDLQNPSGRWIISY